VQCIAQPAYSAVQFSAVLNQLVVQCSAQPACSAVQFSAVLNQLVVQCSAQPTTPPHIPIYQYQQKGYLKTSDFFGADGWSYFKCKFSFAARSSVTN